MILLGDFNGKIIYISFEVVLNPLVAFLQLASTTRGSLRAETRVGKTHVPFCVFLLVCLSDCEQDYSKSQRQVFIALSQNLLEI